MTELKLRQHIALAFDGGGVRGIIPAMALCLFEEALQPYVEQIKRPILDSQRVRVICGTSSGALLAAGVAIGLTCDEMIEFHERLVKRIFPKRVWIGWTVFEHSRYNANVYREELRKLIHDKLGDGNVTIEQLHRHKLKKNGTVLIITAMDVYARRTKFIKSNNIGEEGKDKDKDWQLWEAVMASSAAPTYFPVVEHHYQTTDPETKQPMKGKKFFVDGGTGSYNDPAYIAARDVVEWQGKNPQDVSLLSFGTGGISEKIFREQNPDVDHWKLIKWAQAMTFDLLMGEAARSQALDILQHFVKSDSEGNINANESMDFRRFQVALDRNIDLDDSEDHTSRELKALGAGLVERIKRGDYLNLDTFKRFGECPEAAVDPAGIAKQWLKLIKSKESPIVSTV